MPGPIWDQLNQSLRGCALRISMFEKLWNAGRMVPLGYYLGRGVGETAGCPRHSMSSCLATRGDKEGFGKVWGRFEGWGFSLSMCSAPLQT